MYNYAVHSHVLMLLNNYNSYVASLYNYKLRSMTQNDRAVIVHNLCIYYN